MKMTLAAASCLAGDVRANPAFGAHARTLQASAVSADLKVSLTSPSNPRIGGSAAPSEKNTLSL